MLKCYISLLSEIGIQIYMKVLDVMCGRSTTVSVLYERKLLLKVQKVNNARND